MTNKYRYPGISPFTSDLKALFFGRDNEIKDLSTFINLEKLIILYGKSGLGKSSLLNAGLLPELEDIFCTIPLRFTSYTKGNKLQPIDIVEKKISKFTSNDNFLNIIESENVTVWQHLKNLQYQHEDKKGILLVFDQFEELFTYPEGVDYFSEVLADLLHNRMPKQFKRSLTLATLENNNVISEVQSNFLYKPFNLKVIFSIRSDKMYFLDRLSTSIPFVLRNCYELTPLSVEHAKQAITEPAEANGHYESRTFTYEDVAIGEIINYLTIQKEKIKTGGNNCIEPFQLQLLCQYFEQLIIDTQSKETIEKGDLNGEAGMRYIMEKFYDNQIKKIDPKCDKNKARKLCEKGLIMNGWRVSQHKKVIEEKYKLSEDGLNYLVKKRILRPEVLGVGTLYELSHDTLIEPILNSQQKRKNQKSTVALIISLIIVLPIIIIGKQNYSYNRNMLLGNKLIKKASNSQNAINNYIAAINNKPHKVEKVVYEIVGNTLLENGKIKEAIDFYKKAIKITPDKISAKGYKTVGNSLVNQNKEKEAIEYYITAIKRDPNNVRDDIYELVTDELSNQGRKDDLKKITELRNNSPTDTNVYAGMITIGYDLFNQGKEKEASDIFIKAIEFANNSNVNVSINILTTLGYALLNQKQEIDAILYFKEAIEKDKASDKVSVNVDVYTTLGYVLLKQDNEKEAIKYFKEAIKKDKDSDNVNVNVYTTLGYALLNQGDELNAINYFIQAIKKDSDKVNVDVYTNLGHALLNQNDEKAAIKYFKKAIEKDSDKVNVDVYTNLGHALLNQGKKNEAIEYYKKVLVSKYLDKNKEFDIDAFQADIERRLSKQGKTDSEIRNIIEQIGFITKKTKEVVSINDAQKHQEVLP